MARFQRLLMGLSVILSTTLVSCGNASEGTHATTLPSLRNNSRYTVSGTPIRSLAWLSASRAVEIPDKSHFLYSELPARTSATAYVVTCKLVGCKLTLAYDAYTKNPTHQRTISTPNITLALCIDSKGTLYATGYGFIWAFPRGSRTPSLTIRGSELYIVRACAIDPKGNLWVSTVQGPNPYAPPNAVLEFLKGKTVPAGPPLSGVAYPFGLAFSSAGDLYVADAVTNVIDVFAPGQSFPSRTFSSGGQQPSTIAFDKFDTLYVNNFNGGGGSTVDDFAAGSTAPFLQVTLPNNQGAEYIAVTKAGRLYVGLEYENYVAEYSRGSTKPLQAFIKDGLVSPFGIAIDETKKL